MRGIKAKDVFEILEVAVRPLTAREIGLALEIPHYTASESVQYPLTLLLAQGKIKKAKKGLLNVYEIAED